VLGVGVRGQRDGPQGLLLHAVIVHVAVDLHGEHLRRRHEPERQRVGRGTRHCLHARALTEPAELALRQRPEHDDALGLAGGDGRRPVGDGSRPAATAAAPLHRREAQLAAPEGGREA